MNPSPSPIQSLLQKYNLAPKHYLGQNFLIDEKIFNTILAVADLKKTDLVLEVGPGPGNLTEKLAEQAEKVVAIEKDANMVSILKDRMKKFNNIVIAENSILKANISQMVYPYSRWKVVANIPYYLTSPIIRLFLNQTLLPDSIILLIQKEVAERIVSQNKSAGVISVLVQFYGKVEIIDYVPKEAFWPMPKVDSAIIKIYDIKKPNNFSAEDIKNFFRLVNIGFSSRRKTLANNISAGLKMPKNETAKILENAKLSPNIRAQELSVEEWKTLFQNKEIAEKINIQ